MTEPAVVIALRDLSAKWREIGNRPMRPTGFIICADDLDALVARVEPQDQSAPAVQHLCQSSNAASAPPFAAWCRLDHEWQDGAAKQFDYTCSHCGERIIVNVSQWRKQEAAAARVEPQEDIMPTPLEVNRMLARDEATARVEPPKGSRIEPQEVPFLTELVFQARQWEVGTPSFIHSPTHLREYCERALELIATEKRLATSSPND